MLEMLGIQHFVLKSNCITVKMPLQELRDAFVQESSAYTVLPFTDGNQR